jgi:heme/copper-type cytochrome/quinol oxidase subunit 2
LLTLSLSCLIRLLFALFLLLVVVLVLVVLVLVVVLAGAAEASSAASGCCVHDAISTRTTIVAVAPVLPIASASRVG